MKLTVKQEKFAQYVADGMTQADAYRAAFDVGVNTKPETVRKRASELMDNGDVAGTVEELREKLAAKALWTREMSVKALVQAYREGSGSVRVAAVKELNSMHGYNEAQKLDVQQPINITLKIGGEAIDPEKLGW